MEDYIDFEGLWDAWHCEDEEEPEAWESNDYYVDMAKYAEMDEKEIDNYCFG